MKTATFNLPTLYGDHHVLEVRRLLFQLPGVEDVQASSAFQMVEVGYNPEQLDETQIEQALEAAGYVGGMELPMETGVAAYGTEETTYFRGTQFLETTRIMGFTQKVQDAGRPLWNCPGMGVTKNRMED